MIFEQTIRIIKHSVFVVFFSLIQLWTGVLVGSLYVVSIGLVALLESSAIGWK